MTDTPVSTGLAGLVVEVKDVEAKLAALETVPTPVPATHSESGRPCPPQQPSRQSLPRRRHYRPRRW